MKRPASALEPTVSFSADARMNNKCRNATAKESTAVWEHTDRYGDVKEELSVELETGGDVIIEYCCPFAWLFYIGNKSALYFQMICSHLNDGVGEICFYVDETKPGNVLRPELARSFCAWYWSIANLPDWMRARAVAWHVFCIIPSNVFKKIRGGMSAVATKIMDVFWSEFGWNFERLGMRINDTHVKFSYGFCVVDEKAEKEIFGLKGAGGRRMCVSCLNCVRMDRNKIVGPLVHFTEQNMTLFQKQTPALVDEAHAILVASRPNLSKTAYTKLEKHRNLA